MDSEAMRGELVSAGSSTRARTARAAFLSRYENEHTRAAYMRTIDRFYGWCDGLGLDPMAVERAHLEFFARWLEQQGLAKSSVGAALNALAGLYRFAHLDGLIPSNPMAFVRRPTIQRESTTNGLSRTEFADVLEAAEAHSPRAHALVCLLGLNGLRVSEACGIDVEHLGFAKGYTTVQVLRKGGKRQLLPLSQQTAWSIDRLRRDEGIVEGPVLRRRDGNRLDGRAADRIVKRLAATAGVKKRISPHSFRHAFVTLSLDCGVSERDIANSTGHSDLRMLAYYDRNRESLARNATHALTAYVAGAA